MQPNLNHQISAEAEHAHPPVSDLKKCPLCAELIQASAVRCKHCRSDFATMQTKRPLSGETTIGLIGFAVITCILQLTTIGQWYLLFEVPAKIPLLIWNSVISLGQIGILIGAIKRTAWGRSWAIGTSALQSLNFLWVLITIDLAPALMAIVGVGAVFGLIACVTLSRAATDFEAEAPAPEIPAEAGGLLEYKPGINKPVLLTIVLLVIGTIITLISQ